MTMHLCGARSIAELNRGMLRSRRPWPLAGADGWSAACSQARAPSTAAGHREAEPAELTMVIGWCSRCDGQQSKIRMQDSGLEMSGAKVSSSGQKIQTQRSAERQKAAKS